MPDSLMPYAALAGRLLLSCIFLFSAVGKIADWSGTAESMSKEGMFAVPLLLAGAILFELAGGLSVLLGFRARLGALALILFLIPTTLIFHDFWTFEGMARTNQMHHFLKNLAVMGGLFVVAAHGAGGFSLDARGQRPAESSPVVRREDHRVLVG